MIKVAEEAQQGIDQKTGHSVEGLKARLDEQRHARKKAEDNLSATRKHAISTAGNLRDTEMALASAAASRDRARRELGAALDSMEAESRAREETEAQLVAALEEIRRLRELNTPLTSLQFVRREYYSSERDARSAADRATEAMQKDKEAAQAALREMLKEVGDMKAAMSGIKGLLAEKAAALELKERELEEAVALLENLRAENGRLEGVAEVEAKEVAAMREEKEATEGELRAVKRELGTQRHGREAAEAALQDLMKEMAELKRDLEVQ